MVYTCVHSCVFVHMHVHLCDNDVGNLPSIVSLFPDWSCWWICRLHTGSTGWLVSSGVFLALVCPRLLLLQPQCPGFHLGTKDLLTGSASILITEQSPQLSSWPFLIHFFVTKVEKLKSSTNHNIHMCVILELTIRLGKHCVNELHPQPFNKF